MGIRGGRRGEAVSNLRSNGTRPCEGVTLVVPDHTNARNEIRRGTQRGESISNLRTNGMCPCEEVTPVVPIELEVPQTAIDTGWQTEPPSPMALVASERAFDFDAEPVVASEYSAFDIYFQEPPSPQPVVASEY